MDEVTSWVLTTAGHNDTCLNSKLRDEEKLSNHLKLRDEEKLSNHLNRTSTMAPIISKHEIKFSWL
jgi:hypothetical protein